ncbi:dimethylaniline monooxygenase (N-oxide forming) [Xylogone sp. PMI_703]|nr:dimethylaniline monooxygenase (N-oxide forming) [Xylogone sp. PMI_703]
MPLDEAQRKIKSVAIIGAGAAGAVTAAAFKAENYFERIQVFERRETPGGTWIYDPDPKPELAIHPGGLPLVTDQPLKIPDNLPKVLPPNTQERFSKTPIYESLTTNVPDIAMCFSDTRFPYGPFVPHHIPRQYIENYFSSHGLDELLVLNTTVEDISKVPSLSPADDNRWKLTLRKYDHVRHADIWREEVFDAVVLANGHYSVPFVPQVKGLKEYTEKFPGRVVHSKYYRSPVQYSAKKVVVIGNSASGHDVTAELVSTAHLPVYQSRRSKSRWDGDEPPPGIAWKPVIREFQPDGRIIFDDDTYLDDVDKVIYCTGYLASFPFWNAQNNGRPLWDYNLNKAVKGYWHTFFQDFPTLAIVGLPRVLTFRSFEYQGIALARLFSGRNTKSLPPLSEMERWERERIEESKRRRKKFHDVEWETGETMKWLEELFHIAGLGTLTGNGRLPPTLGEDVIRAINNIKKYPEPGKGKDDIPEEERTTEVLPTYDQIDCDESEWVIVDSPDVRRKTY